MNFSVPVMLGKMMLFYRKSVFSNESVRIKYFLLNPRKLAPNWCWFFIWALCGSLCEEFPLILGHVGFGSSKLWMWWPEWLQGWLCAHRSICSV